MIDYEILAIAEGHSGSLFDARNQIAEKLKVTSAAELKAMEDDEDEDKEDSYLLTMAGNVAHIAVNGGLTGRDSWMNRYFGITSYAEIKKATIDGINAGAGAILYNFNSPGGEVRGMSEVGSFISKLPIPTISFAGGMMASAAYFLGSQADHVYAGDFSEVGSIGVLLKLYDRTKMNEQYGIKVERFRSGDLKAVGDPDFKFSEKERTHIKEQVDLYASKFFTIVSAARGMPLEVLDNLGITSGKTFIGEQAKSVNLVDKIMTFEQVMLKAYDLATKHIDKNKQSSLNWNRK
jgi:signal peptide peptidase SppA